MGKGKGIMKVVMKSLGSHKEKGAKWLLYLFFKLGLFGLASFFPHFHEVAR